MGREVRRVPANWKHPKDENGNERPLRDGYNRAAARWDADAAAWNRGEYPEYASGDSRKLGYDEWAGKRPMQSEYMPDWPPEERTHLQMYENTTEGTPISPVMATPEELARWLADHNASAFGNMTASYEDWLALCQSDDGYAPSMVISSRGIQSGVEGLHDK